MATPRTAFTVRPAAPLRLPAPVALSVTGPLKSRSISPAESTACSTGCALSSWPLSSDRSGCVAKTSCVAVTCSRSVHEPLSVVPVLGGLASGLASNCEPLLSSSKPGVRPAMSLPARRSVPRVLSTNRPSALRKALTLTVPWVASITPMPSVLNTMSRRPPTAVLATTPFTGALRNGPLSKKLRPSASASLTCKVTLLTTDGSPSLVPLSTRPSPLASLSVSVKR